jgi:hypothetical protein
MSNAPDLSVAALKPLDFAIGKARTVCIVTRKERAHEPTGAMRDKGERLLSIEAMVR